MQGEDRDTRLKQAVRDMRDTLNAVTQYARNAYALAEDPEAVREYLGRIDAAGRFLQSLTDDPTETSANMLLSTIGRAHNKNSVFDGDKMLEYGQPPIESEAIRATISLRTDRTDLKIWGVNSEGFYVGRIPAEFKDGWMTFTVGEKMPANYYLIQAE